MLTVEQARKLLGNVGESMSDDEVQDLLDYLRPLAVAVVQTYREQAREKGNRDEAA